MHTIYTIGHSNHPFSHLLAILSQHKIELVADVRRYPSSRHNPQFNRPQLAERLKQVDIEYRFLGNKLGGREDFDKIKACPEFEAGISELVTLATQGVRVAILCAEENPQRCHRHQLLEPEFATQGVKLLHIRGNGRFEKTKQLDLLTH